MERYFAYGSNMNRLRVQQRGLHVVRAEPARLAGFELLFDKHSAAHQGTGHANIAYAPGASVEGVLYWLADAREIFKMDPFEGTPVSYSREVVELETVAGRVACWTYFANAASRRAGLLPSRSYMAHLLAGEPFLSRSYYQRLAAWQCVEDL